MSSDDHAGDRWERPSGVDDQTVAALGKLAEAMEWVERARGRLYDFHQMSGHADLLLGEAADDLRSAGHEDVARAIQSELVGRNVIDGRWTFQIVDEYDDTYWLPMRRQIEAVHDELIDGRQHVYEAEMKERRRTSGHPDHRRRPRAS